MGLQISQINDNVKIKDWVMDVKVSEMKMEAGAAKGPGVCVSWEEKKKELPAIVGEEAIVKRVWEENDGMAYTFIWQMLVSF